MNLIINAYTHHDPLMIAMATARPAYRRHTSLFKIAMDGWARGLDPHQTAMEAMHMGYSLCVVLPFIDCVWSAMDIRLAEYEANRPADLKPAPLVEKDIHGNDVNTNDLNELWESDPNCVHDIQPQLRGGVKCTKCRGWCCY